MKSLKNYISEKLIICPQYYDNVDEKLIINRNFKDCGDVNVDEMLDKCVVYSAGTRLPNNADVSNRYLHSLLDHVCFNLSVTMPGKYFDEMRINMQQNINFKEWWIFVCGSKNNNPFLNSRAEHIESIWNKIKEENAATTTIYKNYDFTIEYILTDKYYVLKAGDVNTFGYVWISKL